MNDENYLEMIEQLKFDRDKYIGMWRSQCQITEQVMKERDAARDAVRAKQEAELRRICEEVQG